MRNAHCNLLTAQSSFILPLVEVAWDFMDYAKFGKWQYMVKTEIFVEEANFNNSAKLVTL